MKHFVSFMKIWLYFTPNTVFIMKKIVKSILVCFLALSMTGCATVFPLTLYVNFLKSHGIYNNQEGIQHRKKLENQYIITYLGTKISNKKNSIIVLKQIGRLKVYKVKNY